MKEPTDVQLNKCVDALCDSIKEGRFRDELYQLINAYQYDAYMRGIEFAKQSIEDSKNKS